VNALDPYAFSFQEAQKNFLLFPWETKANPAIRTEMAGDRDELDLEPLILSPLFGSKGKVNRRKKNHPILF
jgi:hypothetical protein